MGVTIYAKHSKDYDMPYWHFYELMNDIASFAHEIPEAILFSEPPDHNGKLSYKECRELLQEIEEMPDNGKLYGYIGKETRNCLTITLFKDVLKNCISHRCNLYWS